MNDLHEIRRGALLALCQFDAGGDDDMASVRAGLAAVDVPPQLIDAAMALAEDAWGARTETDEATGPLMTEWPIHRQPRVDRSLIRLAAWEIRSKRTPPRVVIDEAVELAREFSTEDSPRFVNGVLDRYWHGLETPPPVEQLD
ncbi:MAG: transcription antitermination factor NusB [Phycisphaerales bacterium]|jgi:N utilization substance protein B|nr:transcription antitermination factor NusB [Phycisphaerales bacterium]